MFSKKHWKAALIRAIRTAAQTAIAGIGTVTLLTDVPWVVVGNMVILSTVLSLLNSVTGLPEVKEETKDETSHL